MADIKKIKPSLPKGTRDFLPQEVAKRNYIFDTIKSVFRKYGFQQIDTPAFERLETLTGKYGEEGDRLLFKILNSGDYLKDVPEAELNNRQSGSVTKHISEKGLRYDLTVPLARYVVQHQEHLAFPFKRFHIGPVWRADRPQKGRYQEFYQCDADVIGSTSLLNEVELTQIYLEVFEKLNLKSVEIRINSRKILEAISIYLKCEDRLNELTTIIDKTDKIGLDGICNELLKNAFSTDQVEAIKSILKIVDIEDLKPLFEKIEIGKVGIEEVEYVLKNANQQKANFDINLARGLNYYTGIIWEASFGISKPGETVIIGSLGGGGRYDNLTEIFGGRDMSGVGISFGIERIYDVLEELDKFPKELGETTKVLFVHFDQDSEDYAFLQLQKVRAAGIASEIYPGRKKLDKQMQYANDKKIPFVVVVGGDEMAGGKLTLKNMTSGEQEKLTLEEIIKKLNLSNSIG
jgi:histidyl-tRNA synthetase